MTEYKIVTGLNFENLSNNVTNEMKKGWIPQGGVNHTGMAYSQAMVR